MIDGLYPHQRDAVRMMVEARHDFVATTLGGALHLQRSNRPEGCHQPGGFVDDRFERPSPDHELHEESGYVRMDARNDAMSQHRLRRIVAAIGAKHPEAEVVVRLDHSQGTISIVTGRGTKRDTFATRKTDDISGLMMAAVSNLDQWLWSRSTSIMRRPVVKRHVAPSIAGVVHARRGPYAMIVGPGIGKTRAMKSGVRR